MKPFLHPNQVIVIVRCDAGIDFHNIWKPANATGRLPILVWIYGGGWVNGGSSPATYSGANLAKEGIPVASFHYRIGHFGWFAHPQLTRENADNGLRINYGTLDQIAALKWIQKNVAGFGGDPQNVTVMGESAGGVSIHMLNTSTLTEGLYHKGISMSGANGGDLGTATLADAEARYPGMRVGGAAGRGSGRGGPQ